MEAGTTEHRSSLRGLEWHGRRLFALCAQNGRFHTNALTAHSYRLASLTAFWIVLELLFLEKILFACREHKIFSTIYADQDPVCEFHKNGLPGKDVGSGAKSRHKRELVGAPIGPNR